MNRADRRRAERAARKQRPPATGIRSGVLLEALQAAAAGLRREPGAAKRMPRLDPSTTFSKQSAMTMIFVTAQMANELARHLDVDVDDLLAERWKSAGTLIGQAR